MLVEQRIERGESERDQFFGPLLYSSVEALVAGVLLPAQQQVTEGVGGLAKCQSGSVCRLG